MSSAVSNMTLAEVEYLLQRSR